MTSTVGTADLSVSVFSAALARRRGTTPVITTTITTMMAMISSRKPCLELGAAGLPGYSASCCDDLFWDWSVIASSSPSYLKNFGPLQTFDCLFRGRLRLLLARAVNQTENHWHKKQGGEGGKAQPADTGGAKGRVRSARFPEAQ